MVGWQHSRTLTIASIQMLLLHSHVKILFQLFAGYSVLQNAILVVTPPPAFSAFEKFWGYIFFASGNFQLHAFNVGVLSQHQDCFVYFSHHLVLSWKKGNWFAE